MDALRAGLAGIDISGEQEPAHCVLDQACNIYERNTSKYLDPASCVSRSHEIQGTTKNRELTFEKGSLVLKSGDDKMSSPTDSEVKVHYAMVRRGLSFLELRLIRQTFESACTMEVVINGQRYWPTSNRSRPWMSSARGSMNMRHGVLLSTKKENKFGPRPWRVVIQERCVLFSLL